MPYCTHTNRILLVKMGLNRHSTFGQTVLPVKKICGKSLTNWFELTSFSASFVEFAVIEHVQVLKLLRTTDPPLFAAAKLQETVELTL